MGLKRTLIYIPIAVPILAVLFNATGNGEVSLAMMLGLPLVVAMLIGVSKLGQSKSGDDRTARQWEIVKGALSRLWVFFLIIVAVLLVSTALQSAGGGWAALGAVLMLGFFMGCGLLALGFGYAPTTFIRLIPGRRRGFRQAMLLVLADRGEEAIEPLSRYIGEHPSDAEALYMHSRLLLERGRVGEAFDSIEQGIALKETSVGLTARAYGLKQVGAAAEAESIYVKVHDTEPLMWNLCPVFAELLLDLRRPHAAINVMKGEQKALRTSFSTLTLGRAYRMAGDERSAARQFEDAAGRSEKESKKVKSTAEYGATALAYLGADRECESVLYEIEVRNSTAFEARAILDLRNGNREAVHAGLFTHLPSEPGTVVNLLTDPLFAPLLSEAGFRQLLAWALGLQRAWREQIRVQYPALLA